MPATTTSPIAIVLAGREDTEAGSPFVLRELCGQPIIRFVLDGVMELGVAATFVVIGRGNDELATLLKAPLYRGVHCVPEYDLQYSEAFRMALANPATDALCFVLPCDMALVGASELRRLADAMRSTAGIALLTASSASQAATTVSDAPWSHNATESSDVVPSLYACRIDFLREALSRTERGAADAVLDVHHFTSDAERAGGIARVPVMHADDLTRIRNGAELAAAEEILYARIALELRRAGATIRGKPRIDAGVIVEPGAVIEDGVSLRGATHIATGARVDIGSVLTDVTVAARAVVKPYSVCTQTTIAEAAEVGPFCHLRPQSEIQARARIGNFVETKNVVVHSDAMANHLAYLGDGDIGEGANIGAGTIFCNSDGVNKYRTEVGRHAFVGSDCQLVAPVRVGEGAFVATGTTVTRDVPDHALAIARVPQQNKDGYANRLRARFAAIAAKLALKG